MPNRLQHSTSPYLLQHADNPVDWYPWGEEAFRKAQDENKPIFLSVGYSTCHWCHVMAHESFENEATGAILNEHFVNVKVDREERPDVDSTYMAFIQATSGGGGWPMNVWLTPELVPILGGTYFPPTDQTGRAGFPRVAERVAELWQTEPDEILERGRNILEQLQKHLDGEAADAPPGSEVFDAALTQFAHRYDHHHGGFSDAPKFPRPAALHLLLRLDPLLPENDQPNHARDMALKTLVEMAQGGIHDHLGGGFHRYSVDGYWHVPHFEKMLYDQGQLATCYLEAWSATGHALFLETAQRIFEYVLRDLSHPDGGFYSAEDADSAVPEDRIRKVNPFTKENAEAVLADLFGPEGPNQHHGSHGKEGAFYVWTKSEIEAALGTEEAELVCRYYGIEGEGNARPEADPSGEFQGENILHRAQPLAPIAKELRAPLPVLHASLKAANASLFKLRESRPRPHRDEKLLVAWNALMISALATGARLTGDGNLLASARSACAFLKAELWDEENKTLYRSWKERRSDVPAFAADHAYLIEALIELHQADGLPDSLVWALELQEAVDMAWWDEANGGYYSTRSDGEIPLSIKEDHDGAEPSANGIAARNLLRLGALLHRDDLRNKGERILAWAAKALGDSPLSCPMLVSALDLWVDEPRKVVVVGEGPLLADLRKQFRPRDLFIDLEADGARAFFADSDSSLEDMKPIDGRATAYACQGQTCQPGTTDLDQIPV